TRKWELTLYGNTHVLVLRHVSPFVLLADAFPNVLCFPLGNRVRNQSLRTPLDHLRRCAIAAPADRPLPRVSAPPLLVGREGEQGILRERLDAALAGRGSLVLIGGEAGIGKTALAEWLRREAAEQDVSVLVGRCYALSETPPYGPWLECVARY